MVKKVSVIGGDLRIVKLIEMLAEEGIQVATYGLEKAESIMKNQKVEKCNTLQEAVAYADFIIGPIPLSSNGIIINTPFSDVSIEVKEVMEKIKGKTFIAGSIQENPYRDSSDTKVIDLLKREELAVLNTISTAEGAIQIAMEETPRTLHGSNVLILGFGRVGKMLANMLQGIGAKVSCEARKNTDIAWIKAYGYRAIHLKDLNTTLKEFDIIINTIPYIILDEQNLEEVKKECLLIDLASNPGGIDKKAVKEKGLKMIWALSLPGKVAPITSAEFIKDTIYNIIKEIEK